LEHLFAMIGYRNARLTTLFRALVTAFGVAWASSADAQFNFNFNSEGPAPSSGPANVIQSGDAVPNGTVSGAIQAVLPDPNNANRMFIGGVAGGIWSTTNGGQNWTPLTDHQSSLSIASLWEARCRSPASSFSTDTIPSASPSAPTMSTSPMTG
jgi:hypothetical protein